MLNGKTVAVVVPAYNEESQIHIVIDTMPDFVDKIIIVNDKSKDKTSEAVTRYLEKENGAVFTPDSLKTDIVQGFFNYADVIVQKSNREELKFFKKHEVVNKDPENERVILINHLENGGVGAAIATGYKWAKDHGIDCTAVMAGDGQMDPGELEGICTPVINEGVDYVKGNRLIHQSAWLVIPRVRFFGNSILSILTKLASGYWHISDTQTGYTAISKNALNSIKLHEIYPRYGMPNDILVKLNIAFCTLREIEIKPVYNVGEQSKMKIHKVIPKVTWLLIKLFFKRLWVKYLFKDFHPLFILYNLSFILFFCSLPYLYKILYYVFRVGEATPNSILIIYIFLFISSFQSLLFAMWMDMQDNERLNK